MTSPIPPVRLRAPLLLSSTQWAEKEALSHLLTITEENFAVLTDEERRRYPQLNRDSQAATKAVDDEIKRIKDVFKTTHIAELKRELKTLLGQDIDPDQARIYTRYRENIVEEDFIEVMTRMTQGQPSAQGGTYTFVPPRTTRALDEAKFKEHVRVVSLWDTACENFSYRTDSVLLKPFSYEQASHIDYNSRLKGHPAGPFIAIVRKMDLGTKLKVLLDEAAGANGSLTKRVIASAKATFEFELLEAFRKSFDSKVLREGHDQLLRMLKGEIAPHIWPVSIGLIKRNPFISPPVPTGDNGRLLFGLGSEYAFVGTNEMPLPLFIIKVEQVTGVYSYFPQRKGGALLWHKDVERAFNHFKEQVKRDAGTHQLGWLLKHLALKNLSAFIKLLGDEPRPQRMSWLAGIMYDSFAGVFPEPDLNSLQVHVEVKESPSLPLARAIADRQLRRYRANLNLLATSTADQDWKAFKEALADLAGEVLSLLTTPVPGGVLGLNKLMQGAVFGSLSYSFLQGLREAFKGEANTFASALNDTADLLISGRLIGVASRLHRQRMQSLWTTLGRPRKVILPDGTVDLWRPDLGPYSHLDAGAIEHLTPTADGLYEINGKLFAKVQEGDQSLVVEVTYDTHAKHYILRSADAHAFKPAVKFEADRQAWGLVLDDVQALDAQQLLQRMLPIDTRHDTEVTGLARTLDITAATREQLQGVWQGDPVPGPLADGVRRLLADRLIDQIISDLPLRGEMPVNADSAVFAVLTQLPNWPADTLLDVLDHHGQLIETYGKDYRPGTPLHRVQLKRLDNGGYVASDAVAQGSAQIEQMFTLILDQLPQTATLGLESNPDISKAGRIALVREQIAIMAREEKHVLFDALTRLEGHTRSDPAASLSPGKKYLPLLYPPISDTTTPLLAKLHELNASLSIECLEQLLIAHPFNARDVTRALEQNSQPLPFTHAANRLKVKLRVDQVLDAIYHRRVFNLDSDRWVREFARGVLEDKLDRRLLITDPDSSAQVVSRPDDRAVLLKHHGSGTYEAISSLTGRSTTFTLTPDSFFLALSQYLNHEERLALGMEGGASIAGLRKTLADALLSNREANGEVNLWDRTTVQYEQKITLANDPPQGELGLYEIQGKKYVSLYGAVYRVEFDTTLLQWRMVHPDKVGVNTPVLEHNYDGAWRQKTDNPQRWSKHQLLRRLRAEPVTFSDEVGDQIMAVSNTSEGVLLQVHLNNLKPPPLLIDTLKRFRIEDNIKAFVHKMQAHHTLTGARADFQLLLIQSLPGWPQSKVLRIVDAQGNTLKEYGSDLSDNLTRIQVNAGEMDKGRLLRTVVLALNETETRTLLGEYDPVVESRMLALAKGIATHALKREANFFKSIYENQEHSADPHVMLVQKHYPLLPKSVIENLLIHTSATERTHFLDKNMIPPRLAEQITWTLREVRLTRAFEGLYLDATVSADSEKITLHTLQSLPGWPQSLRLEVRRNELGGELIDSIGTEQFDNSHVLVKRDERYLAYSRTGQPINETSVINNNLLSSILHLLKPEEHRAIGVKDSSDVQTLGEKISEQAHKDRVKVQKLLGLEPPLPPRIPPMNVDSSFIAYPLTVSLDGSSHSIVVLRQVRTLYPGLNYEGAVRFLDDLGGTEASQLGVLAQNMIQFNTLQTQLNAWAQVEIYPTGTSHVGIVAPGHRRQVLVRIIRAWRRETPDLQALDGTVIGPVLDLHGFDVGDLPAITGDFSHIRALRMDSMNLRSGSNEFLSRFTQLHTLSMSNNRLISFPHAISNMPDLRSIELSHNYISLTAEMAEQLTNRPQLEALFLDNNSISAPLDVSRMTALRELSLERAEVSVFPDGLWTLPHLELANLRLNQITNVPLAVFDVQMPANANRAVRLAGNALSDESRDRIITYWGETGINFGYIPAVAHSIDLRNILRNAKNIFPWLMASFNAAQRQEKAQKWALLEGFGNESEKFFHLLSFMVADKPKFTPRAWDLLINRVWILIDQMFADTVLRDVLFKSIFYDERTCGDGAMMMLENMEIQVLIRQAEMSAADGQVEMPLFKLAKQLFRLRQVDKMADAVVQEQIKAGHMRDVAEVQLLFRVELVESLDLPTQTREMIYQLIVADLIPKVHEARDNVRAMDGSPAFMYSIRQEKFWREFLKNKYAERFEPIEAEFLSDYQKLSAEEGLSPEVERERGQHLNDERDQKVERLIEELTLQAYQASANLG